MKDTISRSEAIETILQLTNFGSLEKLTKYVNSPIRARGWIGGIADSIKVLQALQSTEDNNKDQAP